MRTLLNIFNRTISILKLRMKSQMYLPTSIKVYVPSTTNVNEKIDNTKYLNETLHTLSNLFGGCTMYESTGVWESMKRELVKENVNVCQSFTNKKTLKKNLQYVVNHCEYLKKDMKQEGISLEIGNKFYVL